MSNINPDPNTSTDPSFSEQDSITKAYKERRPVTLLAAFGLMAVTAGAVGGLIYDLAVNGGSESLTQLGTLATLGVGGLLALAGAKSNAN